MRCEMCKKEFKDHKEAEYHHIDMYVYGGPSETDNIMLLCTSCHDEIHRIKIPGDSLTEKDLDEEEK